MKMNIRIIISALTIALLPSLSAIHAQVRQPHALYFMETIPQITQMNPALQPRANGFVMLPGVNLDYRNDLAVKDILQQQGNKWYTPVEELYDYSKLRRSIGKKATMINASADADIIGFGFRTGQGRGYFTFQLTEHATASAALPNDLFKITERGFPDGTFLDFSPLRAHAIAYLQASIGYSHQLNDRLTIGVNLKPLLGQAAVTTKIDRFSLKTGKEQWDLNAKGNVYASGPADVVLDAEGKIDDVQVRSFDGYKTADWIKFGTGGYHNPGIALDLGAAYRFTEKLTLSAALNNLGFISWKQDLNSAEFNGQYTFTGLEYDPSLDQDIEVMLEKMVDDIENAANYTVQHNKFRTFLPPILHAAAEYQFTPALSAGLLSRSVFWKKAYRQSFHGSLNIQPYSFLSFNLGATWQVKSNISFGGGFMFLLGPLQYYFLIDGVPARYANIRIDNGEDRGDEIPYIPTRLKTFTARTGINLVFGRHGYTNRPMLDRDRSSWN